MDYSGRINKVRAALPDIGVDALLVTNLTNVRYLTGFSGSNGQVLVKSDGAIFFSDPRYAARAADLVQSADIVIYSSKLTEVLPEHVGSVAKLGVEGTTMTLAERDSLAEALSAAEIVATKSVVEDRRRVKEPAEIELIRRAVEVGDETFEWILDRLTPGVTEREIALDLEIHMRQTGAEEVGFDAIVGSGPLSAHIHHTPSERAFEKGDFVLLDYGACVDGYRSDLTRTVVLGASTDEQRSLYDHVLEAQSRGIAAVADGAAGVDVDAAARNYITEAGHGDDFSHGLGHGVGLDIHEAPRLATTSEDVLAAGEVVTVEPGIYIRDSGGVRIEDCVLVTSSGAEVLGRAPKDRLIEL
jgi:Xaa-Pro aminopeptidase